MTSRTLKRIAGRRSVFAAATAAMRDVASRNRACLSTSANPDQIVNIRTNGAFFPKARKFLIALWKFGDSRRAQKSPAAANGELKCQHSLSKSVRCQQLMSKFAEKAYDDSASRFGPSPGIVAWRMGAMGGTPT